MSLNITMSYEHSLGHNLAAFYGWLVPESSERESKIVRLDWVASRHVWLFTFKFGLKEKK